MNRLTFQVSVEVDPHWVNRRAATIAVQYDLADNTRQQVRNRLTSDIENALSDAVIHKDGIVAGSVRVLRAGEN